MAYSGTNAHSITAHSTAKFSWRPVHRFLCHFGLHCCRGGEPERWSPGNILLLSRLFLASWDCLSHAREQNCCKQGYSSLPARNTTLLLHGSWRHRCNCDVASQVVKVFGIHWDTLGRQRTSGLGALGVLCFGDDLPETDSRRGRGTAWQVRAARHAGFGVPG